VSLLWRRRLQQHLKRALAGLLRAFEIDLINPLRHVSEHNHLIGKDVHEAAVYGKGVLLFARPRPQLSDGQLRDERGMIGKDAELSIDTRRQNDIHLATKQLFMLGHNGQP
jgi:hypothetical protein